VSKIIEKSRYLAVLGVLGLLVTALGTFLWGLYTTGLTIYAMLTVNGKSTAVLIELIKVMDIFLIATTLLIFAASLYELFVAELNVPGWMIAHNLHELKAKLSSMIVLLLAGIYVEYVFSAGNAQDLMMMGFGIAAVSGVLIAFGQFGGKD